MRFFKLIGGLFILLILASVLFYAYIYLSSPKNADEYISRGVSYALEGDYYKAIDDFDRAVELNPQDPRARYVRGIAYFGVDYYSNSWDDFNKAIELDPNYAKAYYARAIANYDMLHSDKRYNKSISDYEKAILLGLSLDNQIDLILDRSNIAWAYLDMGYDYRNAGEHTKAISVFTKGIEVDPDVYGLYDARGYSYYILEDYSKAVSDFTHSIELEPHDWNYRLRGKSYSKSGEYSKGLSDYGKAIEHDSDKSINYWARGETYLYLGEYSRAISDFSKAIDMEEDPKLLWLYYFLRGETYTEMGDQTRAKSDSEMADKLYNQVFGSSTSYSLPSSKQSSRVRDCKADSACISFHVNRALAGY